MGHGRKPHQIRFIIANFVNKLPGLPGIKISVKNSTLKTPGFGYGGDISKPQSRLPIPIRVSRRDFYQCYLGHNFIDLPPFLSDLSTASRILTTRNPDSPSVKGFFLSRMQRMKCMHSLRSGSVKLIWGTKRLPDLITNWYSPKLSG